MKYVSSTDHIVVRGLLLCFMSVYLSGCMASAAVSVLSQTVKTTAKVAGGAARITVDGAKAVSHTVTKPFRKNEDEDTLIK
jgi:hypothetical protein